MELKEPWKTTVNAQRKRKVERSDTITKNEISWENDVNEKKTEILNGEVKWQKRSGRYGTKTKYEKNMIT